MQGTISGSFRRFFQDVYAKMQECTDAGIVILSPRRGKVTHEVTGFVFLDGDTGGPEDIETRHLQCISRSDFLYVVNPGGYIGPSATLEVGYAIASSVPVFCSEVPSEPILSAFVQVEPDILRMKQNLSRKRPFEVPRNADLSTLQSYIRRMVQLRGFGQETLRDVVLLLVEEVGELAKAVRSEIGLKMSEANRGPSKSIAHELADCLIYILDVANLAGVDLESALREKEDVNSKKEWKTEGTAREGGISL